MARNPMRFEILDAFAAHGRVEDVSLQEPQVHESFLGRARESLKESLANDALMHGLHTQALFESLMVALGRIRLLKQEDAGEVFAVDRVLRVPDYRCVLDDGSSLLVEVKNFHQRGAWGKPYRMSIPYVEGLRRYGELVHCPVHLAVYWAAWNIWTLTPLATLNSRGGKMTISLEEAAKANHLGLLGDMWIGTKAPLTFELVADPSKPRDIDPTGKVHYTVGEVRLLSDEQVIRNRKEASVAFYLMLYGDWEDDTEASTEDGKLRSVAFNFGPVEETGQGFEFVGSLSGMFSRRFRQLTSEGGRVDQLRVDVQGGSLGRLIPKGYKGKDLHLWRFEVRPS